MSTIEAVPKKKTAIDALVAKDRVAVFWFLATCLVAGACAWYLVIMAEALKDRPPFVVMDSSGAFYVEAGVNYPQAEPMHLTLTELAVETLFDRTPNGLANDDRLSKLCDREGLNELREKVREEDSYFLGQQVHQALQVQEIKMTKAASTAVRTRTKGLVTRNLVFNGQPMTERYQLTVDFVWTINPDVRESGAFPSVIHSMPFYEMTRISEP